MKSDPATSEAYLLHNLRNPHGRSSDELRSDRNEAADRFELSMKRTTELEILRRPAKLGDIQSWSATVDTLTQRITELEGKTTEFVLDIDKAEELAMNTSYAHEAVEHEGSKINSADAGAFFLEGAKYAGKRITELEEERDELKRLSVKIYTSGYASGHHDTVEGGYTDIHYTDEDTYFSEDVAEIIAESTLTTNSKGES